MTEHRAPASAERAKATLFCPDCGHESPVGGDWRVRDASDVAVYECPDCGADIARRGREPLVA